MRVEFVVTTDAVDVSPPELLRLEAVTPRGDTYCADLDGVFVEWEAAGSPDEVLTLEVEVWRGTELLGVVFPRTAPSDTPPPLGTSSDSDCFGTALVDGVTQGDELTLRGRVWDAAGNASNVRTITVVAVHAASSPQSCERWCSATPGAGRGGRWAVPLAGLAILTGLLVRRGRRDATARG